MQSLEEVSLSVTIASLITRHKLISKYTLTLGNLPECCGMGRLWANFNAWIIVQETNFSSPPPLVAIMVWMHICHLPYLLGILLNGVIAWKIF